MGWMGLSATIDLHTFDFESLILSSFFRTPHSVDGIWHELCRACDQEVFAPDSVQAYGCRLAAQNPAAAASQPRASPPQAPVRGHAMLRRLAGRMRRAAHMPMPQAEVAPTGHRLTTSATAEQPGERDESTSEDGVATSEGCWYAALGADAAALEDARWARECATELQLLGVQPERVRAPSSSWPATAATWTEALGAGTQAASVCVFAACAPPPRRGGGAAPQQLQAALLVRTVARPMLNGRTAAVLLVEDQDGARFRVGLAVIGGADLCNLPALELAERIEALFPRGMALALRAPCVRRPTPASLAIQVSCKAPLDAAQPGGGSIVFMAAAPLPRKSLAQRRFEAEVAWRSADEHGDRAQLRAAHGFASAAVRAAVWETGGAAAALLRNLCVAEASVEGGSRACALAYAVVASRICVPDESAQRGQSPVALCTALSGAQHLRQPAAAWGACSDKGAESGAEALARVLSWHQDEIVARVQGAHEGAAALLTAAASRANSNHEACAHSRAALERLAHTAAGEALAQMLMVRAFTWRKVRRRQLAAPPRMHLSPCLAHRVAWLTAQQAGK